MDPGVAATRFALNNGPIAWAKHAISHWIKGTLVSPEVAANSIVRLATLAEPHDLAGKLFRNGQVIEASEPARSRSVAQDLWNESARLIGAKLDLGLSPKDRVRRRCRFSPKAPLDVYD